MIFFEACKDESPTRAGVDLLGLSYSVSLIAIVAGFAVKKTGNYSILMYIGWMLTVIGAGLLTTLRADTSLAMSVGFQIVIGSGVGIVFVVTLFPILASLPVTQSAPAMALYVFSRNFGYVSPLISNFLFFSDNVVNDVLNIDLGRDCWRCHHSKRTKEKFARVFPYAIPAGCRDCI